MEKVIYQDLGRISYKEAWDYQQVKLKEVVDRKLGNRGLEESEKVKHDTLFVNNFQIDIFSHV